MAFFAGWQKDIPCFIDTCLILAIRLHLLPVCISQQQFFYSHLKTFGITADSIRQIKKRLDILLFVEMKGVDVHTTRQCLKTHKSCVFALIKFCYLERLYLTDCVVRAKVDPF